MKRVMLGIAMALAACSSDRPDCVQAVEHEKAARCAIYDEMNPTYFCETYAPDVFRNCESKFDDWLRCVGEIAMDDCELCSHQRVIRNACNP